MLETELNIQEEITNNNILEPEIKKTKSKNNRSAIELDKKTMIMLGLATALILFLSIKLFLSPKYSTLYTELSQSDAAAISSYLQKNNIKFEISPEGDKISVAGTSVPKLRLELANKGMPKGEGVGFEIFDKTNLNISDFNQKINYKRALEGELSRTISSLDSIKSAKVHLALANKSIFKDQNETSKASVVLVTEYMAKLSDEQIKGIQHLVASSIPDLNPNDVQITDHDGNSLVKFNDENSLSDQKVATNDKKLKDFEAKLERDLTNLLSPILGTGNVLINVSAEMNFDESEINIELFNPVTRDGVETKPVIRSEKIASERYNNKDQKRFGTGGIQHTLPGFIHDSEARDTGNGKDYIKEDKTKNYEVSKSIERIRKATGLVKKISIAVVVNKDLNASERGTLRQTVQAAAGLDMERGDQIVVTGIKFSSTPYSTVAEQQVAKKISEMDQASRIKKYLSLILIIAFGILVAMLVMYSMTMSINTNQTQEIEELLKKEDVPLLNFIDEKIQEVEEAYSRHLSLDGNRNVEQMKQGLTQMAIQDPKTIARGLQAYIME
jgi:flagellar M-ring protein FliF